MFCARGDQHHPCSRGPPGSPHCAGGAPCDASMEEVLPAWPGCSWRPSPCHMKEPCLALLWSGTAESAVSGTVFREWHVLCCRCGTCWSWYIYYRVRSSPVSCIILHGLCCVFCGIVWCGGLLYLLYLLQCTYSMMRPELCVVSASGACVWCVSRCIVRVVSVVVL